MKDSRKSSRVPPAPAADLRQAKSLLPKDRPARVGFKPKSSSLSNAVRSKNHLAWYVALNKHSEKKIPHIPQIKWKCPPKFALNTDWRVAAGEESQDAEAQKCRDCECHDDSQTPIIPLIPIEEAAAEMPFDTSVTVNARINPQPPASCSSVSEDIPVSQADPSESQDQSVIGKSLPCMLHGLESSDLEIAAATVAAVMQSKDQIDPELLIKFLSNPEMIKKMMSENGFTSKPEDKAPSEPEATTCLPLPSLTPASAVDKLDNGGNEPASKATTCSPLPSLTPASAVDKHDNGGNEPASKATTCLPLPSLTPASAVVDKLDNRGNEPASKATTCLPLPSLTPASAVDKLDNGGNEPASKAIQSNSVPEAVKKSPIPTEIKKVTSKVGGARAGSGRIHTSNAVKGPSHSPRFNSDGPTKTSPAFQISRQQKVRPPVRSVLRPHEETTIDRLVKKYGGPDISVKRIGPLNSSPSMLNLEVAKKMIHNYGAADVARVKPMAPLAASPSMPPPSLLPCHGRRQPFMGPSPSLLSSTASSPMTNLLRSRVDATDYVMLQPIDIPLDGDDAIELYKFCAKKGPARAAVAAVKGNASFELPPPSTQTKKKKRVVEVDTSNCSNDNITLTFPSSASANSNFDLHSDEVKKLLFPKDKATFEQLGAATVGQSGIRHAFQGVQIMIYLTKKVAELGGQAEVLRAEVVALRAEHETLMSRKMEAERLAAERQEQLNLRDLEATRLQSALSEVEFLKAQVAESDKMIYRAARNAEIKVRAEMLDDYLNGRASSWNVDKIYADREELERIMASDIVPTERGFCTYE